MRTEDIFQQISVQHERSAGFVDEANVVLGKKVAKMQKWPQTLKSRVASRSRIQQVVEPEPEQIFRISTFLRGQGQSSGEMIMKSFLWVKYLNRSVNKKNLHPSSLMIFLKHLNKNNMIKLYHFFVAKSKSSTAVCCHQVCTLDRSSYQVAPA